MLAVLTRDQLDRSIFPLGDSTKAQVRAEAAARGLAVADKPDSHDICFIADGDTQGFLDRRLGETPGDIVDGATGAVLGHHAGAHGYTIGQRKGLRLDRPAADGRAALRAVDHAGHQHRDGRTGRGARRHRDHGRSAGVDGHAAAPDGSVRAEVQMRAHGDTTSAEVAVAPDGTLVATLGFAGTGNRRRPSHRGLSKRPGRRRRARVGHDRPGGPPGRGRAVTERFAVVAGVRDRNRLAARYGHRRGGQDRARRVAGSAVPARASRPRPGRRHDRPERRAAGRDAGRALRRASGGSPRTPAGTCGAPVICGNATSMR